MANSFQHSSDVQTAPASTGASALESGAKDGVTQVERDVHEAVYARASDRIAAPDRAGGTDAGGRLPGAAAEPADPSGDERDPFTK